MTNINITMQDKGVCAACLTVCHPLKCGRCKGVAYCSKECQATDWSKHKSLCKKDTTAVVAKRKFKKWSAEFTSQDNFSCVMAMMIDTLKLGCDGFIVEIYDLDLFVTKTLEEVYVNNFGARFIPSKKDDIVNEMKTGNEVDIILMSQNPTFLFKIHLKTGQYVVQGIGVPQELIDSLKKNRKEYNLW